jgi:hypothetical protein
MWTIYNLLMISTPICHKKMHTILIFNHYLIRCCGMHSRYGLHILVQMYMDFQLDGEHIRVKVHSLVYIMKRMLERGIH